MFSPHGNWMEMQFEMFCHTPVVGETFFVSINSDRLCTKFDGLLALTNVSTMCTLNMLHMYFACRIIIYLGRDFTRALMFALPWPVRHMFHGYITT